jgi:hypothetical protein
VVDQASAISSFVTEAFGNLTTSVLAEVLLVALMVCSRGATALGFANVLQAWTSGADSVQTFIEFIAAPRIDISVSRSSVKCVLVAVTVSCFAFNDAEALNPGIEAGLPLREYAA